MAKKILAKRQTLEEKQKLITDFSVKLRGEVLERCIEFEMAINQYIMTYFHKTDKNKQFDVLFYLLDRMSFDAKISVFQEMLKQRFGDDYKNICERKIGKLRWLKEHRNVFAHYMTDLRADSPSNGVNYFKFRNKMQFEYYDLEKIETIFTQANEVVKWIEELSKTK